MIIFSVNLQTQWFQSDFIFVGQADFKFRTNSALLKHLCSLIYTDGGCYISLIRQRKTKDMRRYRRGAARSPAEGRAKRKTAQMKASFHLCCFALDFAAHSAAKFRAAPSSISACLLFFFVVSGLYSSKAFYFDKK